MFSFIAFSCLVVVATAAPYHGDVGLATYDAVPRYHFNYAVNDPVTGDNKHQSETRDGGYVRGSYSLAEPDGTVRVVDYTADPVSGFNAIVRRIGQAVHPQVARPVVQPVVTQYATPISHAPLSHAPISHAPISHASSFATSNVDYNNDGYDHYNWASGLSHHGLGYNGHIDGSWNLGGHGYYGR
ncbi:larval cuticle protein A3A-like [Zerene cesonia]|uniref:larval cuticle protein A3A-like n=1 Tax=Zerene cesonia TaxID=33412 RepID=UPI0018E4FAFF|nr:larval cuticle protein A3A-like [Zerene cesonia]